MIQVIKRDGDLADFTLEKIKQAIAKAFKATGKDNTPEILELLALRVTSNFQPKTVDGKINVEQIQDSVEQVLIETGYTDVAKSYILYRKQRERIRNINSTNLDYKDVVDGYVKTEDWRVKENSTITYSVGGLILSNSGAVTSNYWLSEIYPKEISDAHRNGDFHIHDLSMLTSYCCGWSLKQLLLNGLGGITGKITAAPAKHLASLCNQMVNFLGIMQNEWAASQSFSSFDTYLAPFVKMDNLSYGSVKKCIEAFVFGINTPCRWGTQAPFSNITFDWTVPADMASQKAIVGGKEIDFTYGDCQAEMDMVNKAYLETMLNGDANGLGFQYPIPTYSITEDFQWDESENVRLLFEMACRYGTPYFANCVNSGMKKEDVRSMTKNELDYHTLYQKSGGFFGFGELSGSIGVVTLNLPRLAYNAKNKEDFFRQLDTVSDLAAASLDIKRQVITRLMNNGLYPYTNCYLGSFDRHFSTIGVIGMNEAGLNAGWLRKGIDAPETTDFAVEVLTHLRQKMVEYQLQYHCLFNLEATPAESASYRFAQYDKAWYSDIITAGEPGDTPYYTNSTNLAVGYTNQVFKALDIQDKIQPLYSSGTVFHVYLNKKPADWKKAAELVKEISKRYHIPYYTLTPTYSICNVHGYLMGSYETCPLCGESTEIYSRIVGYYRPVEDWNSGKQQEFKNRVMYLLDE